MTDLAGLIERLEGAVIAAVKWTGHTYIGNEVDLSLQDARDILTTLRALQASTGEGGGDG